MPHDQSSAPNLHPDAANFHPFDFSGQREYVLSAAREGRATFRQGDPALFHSTAWVYVDDKPFGEASTVAHYVTKDLTDSRRFSYRLVPETDWKLPRHLRG